MRYTLQGFTMFMDGLDFGIDTEEVELPIPTPITQEYRGGGQDLGLTMPMAAIEALEVTVKMSGHNPAVLGRMALGPGITTRISFRGAVQVERTGGISAHLCVINGSLNGGTRDRWQRGEKSGLEFIVNGIDYFRYEADTAIIHELQVWPPKRVVNGVDQLAQINAALGY